MRLTTEESDELIAYARVCGGAAGNRCLYPAADAEHRPRLTSACGFQWFDGKRLMRDVSGRYGLMDMIYLLGGPPRVGKSTISRAILREHGISVVSTDSLGAVLENVSRPEAEPGLFVFARLNERPAEDRIKLMLENTAELINYTVDESRAVWKAVKPFILKEEDEGRDVLIEGVAVLPELVGQLENVDYRVVFIANQGNEHKENIKKGADNNEHDWMRHASSEYINAFATFVMRMSAYIEQEAHKYGFSYIEMDGRSFQDIAGAVVESLGLKAR